MEKVEEGRRARIDKATKRGMEDEDIQSLNKFADKLRDTVESHRDTTAVSATNDDEELSKRIDILGDLLSAIVSRVLKHRKETPQIVEQPIKLPPKPQQPATTSSSQISGPQVDSITKEKYITINMNITTLYLFSSFSFVAFFSVLQAFT